MKLFKNLFIGLVLGTATLSTLFSSSAVAGDFRSASLNVGETLFVNEYVPYRINGKRYWLLLQGDGNFVVYNKDSYLNGTGVALWASGTMPYIKYVTYRNRNIVFFDDRNNPVREINIGRGSEICLRNSSLKPVGCN